MLLETLLSGEESSMHNLKRQNQLYFMLGEMKRHSPPLFILQSVRIKVPFILKGAAGTCLYFQRCRDAV